MNIRVLRPGMLTTVQDLGRRGLQRYGVVTGGAMDALALHVANLLVGNDEGAAGLEITLLGPVLEFEADSVIAICGAELSPTIAQQPVPMGRPVALPRASVLGFGTCRSGCRAYLAIAGGIDVPAVLGSRSTYLKAAFGGFEGRALKANDVIPVGPHILPCTQEGSVAPFSAPRWSAGVHPQDSSDSAIRIVCGPEFAWLTESSRRQMFSEAFTVSPQSDRMGFRLTGLPMDLAADREMISDAVCVGTIQVPRSGEPIILMADGATTGGYARVAHVIMADLPRVAQFKPGDKLRLAEVDVAEAHRLYRKQEADLAKLQRGLRLKQERQLKQER